MKELLIDFIKCIGIALLATILALGIDLFIWCYCSRSDFWNDIFIIIGW